MRAKHLCTALIVVCLAAAASGCGRSDENTQAARIVANAYVRAYADRDAGTICRVLVPSLATTLAAESGISSCEKQVMTSFGPHEAASQVTNVVRSDNNATAYADHDRSRFVTLVKFGSLWRVAASWRLK